MSPLTKPPRKGEHIKRINFGKTEMNLEDRNKRIESENRILFEKIRDIMERPAYLKATLYDSKTMAAKALGSSPRGANSTEMGTTIDLAGTNSKALANLH